MARQTAQVCERLFLNSDSFKFKELQKCISKVPTFEILTPLGDWDGNVGEKADGFEDVYGGFGYGTRNSEDEWNLEVAIANNLFVAYFCLTRREFRLVTYNTGGSKSH